ncbi:MAG: hypothetical protein KatS3mg056_2503 [Chloroflexus sp.]|nr:MAG: hypothetical protein KatS3mg056_2503 [Chloroflexus sp.]
MLALLLAVIGLVRRPHPTPPPLGAGSGGGGWLPLSWAGWGRASGARSQCAGDGGTGGECSQSIQTRPHPGPSPLGYALPITGVNQVRISGYDRYWCYFERLARW